MAHNKLYRNFIILQEDEKSKTSSSDKALSGYAKIEAKGDKCKISFYAQNLNKESKYSMILICYKKDMKQIVDLGSLQVNDAGKGDSSKEYYVNNIAGLDLTYDRISGAAICENNGNELNYLMYGFMNGENVDDNWRKAKVIKYSETRDNVGKEKLDLKIDKLMENKSKKASEEEANILNSEEETEVDKEDIQRIEEEVEEVEENKESEINNHEKNNDDHDCENMEHINEDIKVNFDEYEARIDSEKEVDPFNFELRGSIGEYFKGIVDGFEEIKSSFKEMKFCKWYKVNVNNIDDMCNTSNYNKYTIAFYPMLNYYPYIKKYNHFMLGYKCNNKAEIEYIVYAVPGKKDIDEQPYAGKTGFVTWMESGKGEMGYWLMFYDYKNSTIVVPMK